MMFDLEEAIVKVVNEAQLPLEVKYYVVQTVELRLKEALLNLKLQKEGDSNAQEK